MRKIRLRHFDKLSASLRSANDIRWLSEVEASHNSFRIAILPKNVVTGLFCAIISKLKMAYPFLVLKFLVLKTLAGFSF
jgi:hypothetical protein